MSKMYTELPEIFEGMIDEKVNKALKKLRNPNNFFLIGDGPINFNQIHPNLTKTKGSKKVNCHFDENILQKFADSNSNDAIIMVGFNPLEKDIPRGGFESHLICTHLTINKWSSSGIVGKGTLKAYDSCSRDACGGIYYRNIHTTLKKYIERKLSVNLTSEHILTTSNLPDSCTVNSLIAAREILLSRDLPIEGKMRNYKRLFWRNHEVLEYMNSIQTILGASKTSKSSARQMLEICDSIGNRSYEILSINPLSLYPILRTLFKQIKSVYDLNEFRKVCRQWNDAGLKRLQELSNQGKLEAITFFPKDNSSWNLLGRKMDNFLKDTLNNPQLFHAFDFQVAKYREDQLKIQENLQIIFEDYKPAFVRLEVPPSPFNAESQAYLMEFLKGFRKSVKELKMTHFSYPRSSSPVNTTLHGTPLAFPQLTKVSLEKHASFEAFCVAFGHGGEDTLPSLTGLEVYDISYPDLSDLLRMNQSTGSWLRWRHLTHLHILEPRCNSHYSNSDLLCLNSHLLDLSKNGMILKNFGISFYFKGDLELDQIFLKIQQILEIQADSLKDLHLTIHASSTISPEPKIELPRFKSLHSLQVDILYKNDAKKEVPLFALESLPANFPVLRDLMIENNSSSIWELFTQTKVSNERLHLFKLDLIEEPWTEAIAQALENNIRSVDVLRIPSRMIRHGEKLPWGDSLKKLILLLPKYASTPGITFPLNLGHFTKLDELVIGEHGKLKSWDLQKYLKHFKDIIGLGLSKITFRGLRIDFCAREDFKKAFPFKVVIMDK